MNPDIGMGDDDVNIDVSVVVIDVDVIVMSDFDVSVVMSDFDVSVVMSDVNVNAVLGFGEGDYGDVHLQMNCWHYGKHILASIVYYFFSS